MILCVGRLYCDLIFTDVPRLPSMGTEVFAGGLGVHAGGGAFITAAHLSALGETAALAATLPGAPFRDVVLADLHVAQIDTRLCGPGSAKSDPQVTVVLAGPSDRAFVTRRSGPAFPAFTQDDLRAIGAGHLHIGELGTLLERPDLIALARSGGMTVSLDCGWDDDLDLTGAADLIAAVDLFLPNACEARMLSEKGLSPPFAPLVVTKRGRDGATASALGKSLDAPADPAEVVDATGAGDAFNAGFLTAWLAGAELSECLARGNAQGRVAVSQRGGFRRMAALEPLQFGLPAARVSD